MSDDGTSRTVVKTYVPEYQKSEWKAQAEALDMSQSEFVRTMVQAGRRGFDVGSEDPPEEGSDPGGDALEDGVHELLAREGHLSWDELLERLAGDFEDRLEDALDDLQQADRVRYSGRHGGYTLTETADGE